MKKNKILWVILGLIIVIGFLFYLESNSGMKNEDDYNVMKNTAGSVSSEESSVIVDVKKETIVVPNLEIELNNKKISCGNQGGVWYDYNSSCEINSLSRNTCIERGGEFNECNSACRHDKKAEVCTMQCVVTCTIK